MSRVEQIEASMAKLLPGHLGMRVTEATNEQVTGSMKVEECVCTLGGTVHGGALMAFADSLGAIGAFLNLPEGAHTTTVESKTNFLRAAKQSSTLTGVSTRLNKGRTLMLWQTEIRDDSDRLIAIVSQSQIILNAGG